MNYELRLVKEFDKDQHTFGQVYQMRPIENVDQVSCWGKSMEDPVSVSGSDGLLLEMIK